MIFSEIQNQAPEQVVEVSRVLINNARLSGDEEAAYINFDPVKQQWRVGSNYEDGHHTLIYDEISFTWLSRNPWTGEDKRLTDGYDEALAFASILFTG